MQYLIAGRDVSQFQQLARDFLARTERLDSQAATRTAARGDSSDRKGSASAAQALGIDEAALKAAGFDTSTTRQGVLVVRKGPQSKWIPATELLKA